VAAALPDVRLFSVPVSKSARGGAIPNLARFRPIFNGTAIVLMAAFALAQWVTLAWSQNARETQLFPEPAVAFLQAGTYPRELFIYYDWGGYAIWRLYPAYRVFVDGRADLYGEGLVSEAMQTVPNLRTGWRDALERWKIEALLVPPTCAVAQALLLDPDWQAAFRDSKAIILLKRRPIDQNVGRYPESYLPDRQRPALPVVTTVTKRK
jgi:hypothetical protein